MIDHQIFFDEVRETLFGGGLTQQQVDGMESILDVWDWLPLRYPDLALDLRWLSYMLATTKHETASTMWPIEEYNGADQPYGQIDPETGQAYWGRGFVQLTHRENYAHATDELGLEGDDDLEWHAERALDLVIAARVMFIGMYEGWFRPPNDLPLYFGGGADNPYGAREIINGDKSHVPDWSDGVSIGKLVEGYHDDFLAALEKAYTEGPVIPVPEPDVFTVHIPAGVTEIRLILTAEGD